MKRLIAIAIIIAIKIAALTFVHAAPTPTRNDNPVEIEGTLQRYLLNPHGDVDGFLLSDGTQIKFSAHMSSDFTSIVSPKDNIRVSGYHENAKVFRAKAVTNTKTSETLVETKLPGSSEELTDKKGNLVAPNVKSKKYFSKKELREDLVEMSAQGKIKNHLFGKNGEVVGVILADESIVYLAPQILSTSKVNTEIGKNLKAQGFGTQNSLGKSLEATSISNY